MPGSFDPDAYLSGQASAQPPDQEVPLGGFDPDAYLNRQQDQDRSALQAQYGTPMQQAAAGIEGGLEGLIGPLAPAAEIGLGITTPEAIRGRAAANPGTHGLAKAGTFLGSALTGIGEAAAVGKIGEGAAKLAALEGASTISKITSAGIKTGAEMAALQTSDEISKMVTQDPGQSIGTAALNIGLAGVMGGVGGAAVGAISPIWRSGIEKMGVPKLIDDAKAQFGFRQSLPNGGDVPASITDELNTRLGEVENLRDQMSNLKGSALARAMPEVTESNSAKINTQIESISEQMTRNIEKASENAYLKGAVPKLTQDFQDFLEIVTDPSSTYAEKFDAIDALKRAQQAKARYNLTAEDTALGAFTKSTARDLRLALEDPKVWGDAANIQRDVNAAIKESIDAQKVAQGKFTSKTMDGMTASQDKITTLVNQGLKGRGVDKANVIADYIESTDKLADTINRIHTDAGIEAPIRLTPTPALDHTLGRSSPGTTLGNWLFDKGLGSVLGHGTAELTGAGLGAIVGHPAFGALAGERVLAPAFTAIARPLMESATHAEAFKSTLDFALNIIKGEKLLNKTAEQFFGSGSEVLAKELMPNQQSREKLEKSLEYNSNPDNALKIGGSMGHYLPNHTTAAAEMAAKASNYLKALKPIQRQNAPLDKPAPIDKMKQQQYNRALEVAQQPLVLFQYAKQGTLQKQDMDVFKAIYPPGLQRSFAQKAYDQLVKARAAGVSIPYKQRLGLSLILGQPMDSTLSQSMMQTIMMSNAVRTIPSQHVGSPTKVSQSTSKTMERVNRLSETPLQARESNRRM